MQRYHIVVAFLFSLCIAAALLAEPWLCCGLIAVIFLFFIALARFKKAMLVLGIYMVCQDLLIARLYMYPGINTVVKRAEEVILLIAVLAMVVRNAALRRSRKSAAIDVWLLGLVAAAIASSVKAHIVPYLIASFDLFIVLKGFFVFYLAYNLDLDEDDMRKAATVFFFALIAVCAVGAVDFIFPREVRSVLFGFDDVDYRFGIPSVKSIFLHPAVFGWAMSFGASFCVAFYVFMRKRIYLAAAVLFGMGALTSMRFKSIAGLLCSLIAAALILPGEKKVKSFLIGAVIIILLFVPFGAKVALLFEGHAYTYYKSYDISGIARNALYGTSLKIAKDFFPFGSGLGTFGGYIAALYYSPLYTQYGLSSVYGLERGGYFLMDTFWPYVLGQFGFFGLLFYIVIVALLFRNAIAAFNMAGTPFMKAFCLGVAMIFIEALCESFADPVFIKPPQYFFIFACLGIVSSSVSRDLEKGGAR